VKRLKKSENEIRAFVDELRDDPGKSGSLTKNLVKKTNRFYLNFPFIGPARRISSELKKGPFSYFYIFERTLAHKLHPLLYKYGFNFISNSFIDSLYEQKLEYYKPLVPLKAGKVSATTADLRMKNLIMMKELITRMVFKDGHFMVIQYYDNNFRKLDRDLSSILRSIELSIHNMKRELTEDKKSNREMIRKRYELFMKNYGKENGPLFIERMKWDEELKDYAGMLGKEEERSFKESDSELRTVEFDGDEISGDSEEMKEDESSGEGGDVTENDREKEARIAGYAEKIKEKYLDVISDEDADAVKKILETIYSANREKSGDAKAREIVTDIVKIWLDDELISEGKKNFLRSLHEEMSGKAEGEGEPAVDERLDAISDFVDGLEEENKEPAPEESLFESEGGLQESPPGAESHEEPEGFFDEKKATVKEEEQF
jgi:hypothetical protein